MDKNDNLPILNALMRSYVQNHVRVHGTVPLDPASLNGLRDLRAAIRQEEGGGGMCHRVTEELFTTHGVERMWVSYLDRNGDVICSAHMVSILPDGSILDATADQFGEGHDVRVLAPDDLEYGRYRPEFGPDYHPDHDDAPELSGWSPFWTGLIDDDRQDELRQQRGEGWWLDDHTAYRSYLQDQIVLADDEYREYLERRLEMLPVQPSLAAMKSF